MNQFFTKLKVKIRKTKLLCFLIFASVSIQAQTKWYVNDASTAGDVFTTAVGSDTNTGSKTSPFLTLAKAYLAAAPGDTIIIDTGTFNGVKHVFAKAGLTIIGAGITKTVFDNNSASADANFFADITASNVTLKNFHVTEYNYSVAGGRGKAITVTGAAVTGVVLDGMLLDNNGSSGGNGAFMVTGGAKATIKNGADSCNLPTGAYGGGSDVDGIGSELTITNQYISRNARTGGNGGAVNIRNGGKVTVSNSVFDGNSAINGGAIYVDGGTLIVTNSIFKNNVANQTSSVVDGGAIAIGKNSIATISNSQFISNIAGLAASITGRGGAISLNTNLGANTLTSITSKLSLTNVSFSNNTVTNKGRHIFGDESSSKQGEITINNASFSGTGTSTDVMQNSLGEIVFSISNSGSFTNTNIAPAEILNTTAPTGFTTPTVPNPSGVCVAFGCATDSYFPVITECVANKTIAQTNCTATLLDYTSEVVASDDCAITKTQSPAAGTTLPVGVNTVSIAVTDASGNTTTCTFTVTVTAQPFKSPGFNGTLVICSGTTVTESQLFARLGGFPSTGGTWSPALAGAGTYTYSINNCTNVSTAKVVVTEQAAPNAGNDGTLAICAGTTITASNLFDSLNGTPATNGTWSPELAGAGTYTYTVAATSPCTVNATATVTVTELTPAAPSISSPKAFYCVGDSVVLTATGCTGQIVWSNGQTGPELTVSTPGTYTAICTSNGCESAVSNSLTIEEKPLPTITINGGATNVTACAGEIVRLTAGGGTEYSWSNGMITPFIDVVATNGTYTVIGKDANGCENEATITITANPLPTVVISGATSFCSNATSTLTVSGGVSYSWNTGATTEAITIATAGTYTVTATDANGCTATNSITVATYSCPPPCPTNGNLLANGSFELPQISSNFVVIQQQNWTNLVDGGKIETWKSGFLGVPAVDGNQLIELNAYQLGTIVQTATVSTNVPLTISYSHRSRVNYGQRIRMEIIDLTTNQIIHTFTSSSNLAWQRYSTTFSTPNPSIQVRFVSLNVCTGDAGCGNFMDNVVLNYASCLCTSVPNSPSITTTTTEVNGTTSATLTATGCAGGTIKWNNGQTGASITTNVPGEYFAQCVIANCESIPSNKITLTTTSDASVTCPTFQWRSNGVFHVNYCVQNNGDAPISGTAYVKVDGEIVYSDTYTNLLPGASVCFTYRKRFIPCGTVFAATVGTTTIGTDSNMTNNECTGSQTMNCIPNPPPYDPNFKEVEPKRNLEGGIFTTDDWLTYTVHCQNDGVGRAVDVVMLDKIDITKLDISTLQLVSSTHPVQIVKHLPNQVAFEFHNIQLANSALDLAGSQAEVRFKIKRLPNQPVGTIIENQVGIFFDHEPEVKTNVIASKVIEPCDAASIESGMVLNDQLLEIGAIPATFTLSSYQGIITGWEVSTDANFAANATTKHNVYTNSFTIPTALTQTVYVRALVQPEGCQIAPSKSAKVIVSAPLTASVTAQAITCNGLTTNAVFAINGGTAPYTISPSGTNLVAGDYTFTITDANDIQTTASVTVTEPLVLTATSTSGEITCFGGTTNVEVLAVGGTAPYSISPSTNAVKAGNHLFTVTDANGCMTTTSISISEPASHAVITTPSGTDFCVGSSTTLTAPAGARSYLWNTGEITESIQINSSGTYTVNVTNSNGCVAQNQITVDVNAYDCEQTYCTTSNLIQNGSFENPEISVAWDSVLMPNWTNLVDSNKIEVHKTVLGIPIPNGSQYIELNGTVFGKIYQDVNVVPNKALELSFMYRARLSSNETIKVTLFDPTTNENLYSFNTTATLGVWRKISANYTTSSSQTKVRVRIDALTGYSNGAGNLIDDVVLNYVDCANDSAVIIGNKEVCNGSSSVLSLANNNNIVSYQWSNGSTSPVISVSEAGSYSVTATLTNGSTLTSSPFVVSSCVATASRVVAKTDVNSVNYNVILYPNPSVDTFTINVVSDSNEAINISIYDMLGRNIQNKTLNKDDLNSISFGSNLQSGIYNVIIEQGDKSKSVRLVKK